MNNKLIHDIITVFTIHGSRSKEFNTLYGKYETAFDEYKNSTMKQYLHQSVAFSGVLRRRGDGRDKNLNLVSPAYVNGHLIEHLHVYDEVIDQANRDYETGMFTVSNCKVYCYHKSSRQNSSVGYGIKPSDAPKWVDRNEK